MALHYYNMDCEITISNVVFNTVNSITVKSSIAELSDTATVVLPREFKQVLVNNSFKSFERKNIRDYINEGDAIEIKTGYNNNLKTVFKGYLKSISADVPLKLECEDEMYMLRKTEKFNKTFASVKLIELLQYIAPGYSYSVIDNISLGKFVINNATAYEVLTALKRDYPFTIYFDSGKVLNVKFISDFNPGITHQINLNRIKTASSLKYVSKEKRKLLIKAISINSDGTKITVEKGEQGGDTRTLHFANKTKTELEHLAEKNLNSLNYDGYEGSFVSFGEPAIVPADAVEINDTNYNNSDRKGKYLVEQVIVKFNQSAGYAREVKISKKL